MRRGKFSAGHDDRRSGSRHGRNNRTVDSQGSDRGVGDDQSDPAERWNLWFKLIGRACALGVCGGDWERVIDLTPERFFAVLAEHRKLRAEDRLAALVAINRGFAGGSAAEKHARSLSKQAGFKE